MINRSLNPRITEGPIAWGTVGWGSDSGNTYYSLGDNTGAGSETSPTLVRVTLDRGRDASQSVDQTKAQGDRIVCQVGGDIFEVPPLNARVIVAIPEPHGMVPGHGVIFYVVDPRGSDAFGSGYQAGDKVLSILTSFAQMILKGDGSAQIAARQGDTAQGQPVNVIAKPDGSVSANAQTVNLGNNPTDGVVLQTLLAPQLSDIETALSDIILYVAAVATAAGVSAVPAVGTAAGNAATAMTALIAALANPNYSATVKAQL